MRYIFVIALSLMVSFGSVEIAFTQPENLIIYSDNFLQDNIPARNFGRAIGVICPQIQGSNNVETQDLANQCSNMVRTAGDGTMDDENLNNALGQVSSQDVATQGTNSVNVSNTNIGSRLAALRGGATGISINGLAYNINGETIPFNAKGSDYLYNQHNNSAVVASNNAPLAFALASQAEPDTYNSPFGEKVGLFINGLVTFGDKDRTSREAGFDYHAIGITGGVDYRFTDNLILGAAFSYVNSDVDLDSNGGTLDSNAYSISLYGSFYFLEGPLKNFYIDGIGTIGWIDYDQRRRIVYNLPGSLNPEPDVDVTAVSDFNADQYAFSFTTGYDFIYNSFTFGPFGQLNFLKANIDGYKEDIRLKNPDDPGIGLGLKVDSQDVDSLSTVLGVRGSYALSTNFGVLLPQVLFGWQHEYLDAARTITATFINDTTNTGIPFRTDDPDRDFFDLGLGLSAQFPYGVSSFVYYQTVLAYEDLTENSFVGGIRVDL